MHIHTSTSIQTKFTKKDITYPVFVYGRVESSTVLPMVINTFKPKYAVQRYLGLH